MPAKTNKTKKNKKVTKKIVTNRSILSLKRMIVVLAIVLVGSVAVFAFAEQQSTDGVAVKRTPGNLEASYIQSKPVVVEMSNDGVVKVISSGKSIHISKERVLYCTPEDSDTATTKKVSAQELARVRASTRAAKVESAVSEGDASTITGAQVGGYKSLAVDKNGSTKQLKVFKDSSETLEFKSAISALETLCASATTPIPEINIPSFAPVDLNTAPPATSSKPNIVQKVSEVVTPKVSAQYSATLDPNAENIMRTRIDGARASNGRVKLNRSPCLDNAAREYSSFMAQNNHFAHSNTVFGSILALPQKHCGTIVGVLGENVGRHGTVDQMFSAYMNSPGHRANILGDYTFIGIGTYIQNGTNVPYNTQIFMRCTTCGSAASSSY